MRNLVGLSAESLKLARDLLGEYDIGTSSRFLDGPPEFSHVDELDLALFLSKCESFIRTWPRPIPVSERLPESDERVLVAGQVDGKPLWFSGYFWQYTAKWYFSDDGGSDLENTTHWLPLPPAPNVSSGDGAG